MIKARKERVRELIRSLEPVQVRSRALGEEESSFKGRSSSFTETGDGRTMQRIPRAKLATTSRAPSIT